VFSPDRAIANTLTKQTGHLHAAGVRCRPDVIHFSGRGRCAYPALTGRKQNRGRRDEEHERRGHEHLVGGEHGLLLIAGYPGNADLLAEGDRGDAGWLAFDAGPSQDFIKLAACLKGAVQQGFLWREMPRIAEQLRLGRLLEFPGT
jgi:hypothetical protein